MAQVLKFVAKLQAAARARGDSVFTTEELVTFVGAMKDLKVSSPMELIEVRYVTFIWARRYYRTFIRSTSGTLIFA